MDVVRCTLKLRHVSCQVHIKTLKKLSCNDLVTEKKKLEVKFKLLQMTVYRDQWSLANNFKIKNVQ